MVTRRGFLDALALGVAGFVLRTTAKSYAQIVGSNERVHFAIIGLHARAYAHLSSLKANRSLAGVARVCDVDDNILAKFADATQKELGEPAKSEKDFRRVLESKDVDAITVATPDHWHAPVAIAALEAGKHVYLEKPCGHNPAEGEMLVQAQKKVRQGGPDGNPTAVVTPHDRNYRENSFRSDRQALPGKILVREYEEGNWGRERSTRPSRTGLGSLAGAGAARSLSRQCPSL